MAFPKRGACHAGLHGEAPGLIRRLKAGEENLAHGLSAVFCGEEWVRQGRQLWLNLGW